MAQASNITAIRAPFDRIVAQPTIASFLSEAAATGSLSHAYLFVGSNGSGKEDAALAVAMARICEQGGCASCEECERVIRKSHPDVHWIEPEGAGYLVDQIRDLTRQAALAPVRASHKVFIITRADRLSESGANAFLKTLEEPSESTSFILLAPARDSVIATISSRCQTVSFSNVSQGDSVSAVVSIVGCSEEQAKMALAIKGGSATGACSMLESPDRRQVASEMMATLSLLGKRDVTPLILGSSRVLSAIKAACKDIEENYNNEIEEQGDFLAKGALSSLKKKHKRLVSGSEREMLWEAFGVVRYWLRNKMIEGIGCDELAVALPGENANPGSVSRAISPEAFVKANQVIDKAQARIEHNVTPRLALDTMLLEIREVLHADRHSG